MSKQNENLFKELVEGTYDAEFNYRDKFNVKLHLQPDKLNLGDSDALKSGDTKQIAAVLVKCVDSWELKRKDDEEFTPMNNGLAPSIEFFTEKEFPLPLLNEISLQILEMSQDITGKKKPKTTGK